jgi:uncharacterized protein with HEPN domain
MSENSPARLLDHIQQAATDAAASWRAWPRTTFEDKRTQQAVIMSLIIIGEAVTKVMDGYAEFTQAHGQAVAQYARHACNRIAHGYFDINLDVV